MRWYVDSMQCMYVLRLPLLLLLLLLPRRWRIEKVQLLQIYPLERPALDVARLDLALCQIDM